MDKRDQINLESRERKKKVSTIYNYYCVAESQQEIETDLQRRVCREVIQASRHIEARDVVILLLGMNKEIVKQPGENVDGKKLVGFVISLILERMYQDEFESWRQYPENANELPGSYKFRVVWERKE